MKHYKAIMESNLFRLAGQEIDLCAELIGLCDEIKALPREDDSWLSWGEFLECSAPDLIIGSYWALTEWHRGQGSAEYAARCALGDIFSPGMTAGPEPGSSEVDAYEACCGYFARKSARKPA